ncbi:hypothetical protein QJ857_gp1311 [Tupanvirus soda lake]|uniref:Uncharacterized protein n=2 Tax=Tupanvirus TaxID=2094720 RepID=A0A6N1P0F6_9VIRU|nr:hypothetical protein QJ857_gp1311 [Tupanvirus soda lake]QKU34751.1 hypothetical protein [Tupanvirus soda lake]
MTQVIGTAENEIYTKSIKEITPNMLTTRLQPNKNKFLFIDRVNIFDEFTNKYGTLNSDNIPTIKISWREVANDYRGIGISEDIFEERFALVIFMNEEVNSWWHYECNITNFVEFVNEFPEINKNDESESESSSESEEKSEDSEEEIKKPKCRYFKLFDPSTGKSFGRFTGDTPKQAASKGFTKMLQTIKQSGKEPPSSTKIYMRESTRGVPHKIYGYEASRIKLDQPQELVIRDNETGYTKTLSYYYRNRIKKIPVPKSVADQQ